jgi:hypothetical protein
MSAIESIYGVYDIRQTEIHTAEQLVPEVEIRIEKLKRY